MIVNLLEFSAIYYIDCKNGLVTNLMNKITKVANSTASSSIKTSGLTFSK